MLLRQNTSFASSFGPEEEGNKNRGCVCGGIGWRNYIIKQERSLDNNVSAKVPYEEHNLFYLWSKVKANNKPYLIENIEFALESERI